MDPRARAGWPIVVTHRTTTAGLTWLDLPPGDAGSGLVGTPLGVVQGGGPFVFDPFDAYHAGLVTNPNVVVTGTLGAGKSTLVKLLIARTLAAGRRVVVVDPKGEYGALAAHAGATGSAMWAPWHTPREEQLDLLVAFAATVRDGPLRDDEWAALFGVWRAVCTDRPTAVMAAVVAGLRRRGAISLADLFARTVDGDLAPCFAGSRQDTPALVVWDLSTWWSGPRAGVVALLALAAAEELLVHDARPGLLVLDEAWAVLANPWAVSYLAGSWKLARARGIAHVAVVHRVGDLTGVATQGTAHAARSLGLLADCETTVSFRCAPGDRTALASALDLTPCEQATVATLPRGVALVRFGAHRSVVRLTPQPHEWAFLDTDGAMS